MTTRGEARELLLAQAEKLGERHALAGQPSLRLTRNVISITDLIAGQAGLLQLKPRGTWSPVIDPFEIAAAYSAAYAAASSGVLGVEGPS